MSMELRDIVVAVAAAAQQRYDREYITTAEFRSCIDGAVSVSMSRTALADMFVTLSRDGIVRRRVNAKTSDNAAALTQSGVDSDRAYVIAQMQRMVRDGMTSSDIAANMDIPIELVRMVLRTSGGRQ